MANIHIAFGFHVNCYHSYRGDTNDNLGFGSDIRIIRKIISTLNELNDKGIPVKGTWDSENFFSLEKILPEYAPDIIEGMKERTAKHGDEQIIMGYSNGALSAMNEEEFEASIELAVSNAEGSGLKDLFGNYEKLVRPQEVMFTPSQVSLYNKLGVKALCLYYSCVPFDAFRTIVPRLTDELALNPLTYTYKGESMTIIPTYNNSDICDAGCLRAWVKDLHAKQESGEIQNDLLIFVNMDADAIFWESMNLPVIGNKIANTDGIHGLVCEVADLPYVVFDTPGNYINPHKALGKIDFTQDTADGNFSGYTSWSEKPYNRKIWTAIDRARLMAKANSKDDSKSASFRDRVLLLSTTHFGLATPVLNIEREKKADKLAKAVVDEERKALKEYKKLTVFNITNTNIQCLQMSLTEKVSSLSQIEISGQGLENYAVIPMNGDLSSVFLVLSFESIKERYSINVKVNNFTEEKTGITPLTIKSRKTRINFSKYGKPYKIEYNGKTLGEPGCIDSYITYDNKKYPFEYKTIEKLSIGGEGTAVRTKGEIHLPGEEKAGSFIYDYIALPFIDGIIVRTEVNYPYTKEDFSISTENSSLGRFTDPKWTETVPLQITPCLHGDISIVKRNFMDDISTFRTQSFTECDENNTSIDSFNHQLTAGLVGLCDNESGLIVANARQVLGSMAHCPMRLNKDKSVNMNPFGTYYGRQRHHWSRSGGKIWATFNLVTPQSKSIAPAYNGASETALLGLFGFSGKEPDKKTLQQIISVADGAVAYSPEDCILQGYYEDNVKLHESKKDGIQEKNLKNPVAYSLKGNLGRYILIGGKAIGHIVTKQIKSR